MNNKEFDEQRATAPPTYTPPQNPSLLSNPYVIAGTAIAGAIVLAVMVVIFLGSSGGGGGSGETDRRSNTPVVSAGGVVTTQTVRPGSGLVVRSIAAATVRTGPDLDFGEIGPLRSGQDLTVVGRDPTAKWFQIQFPPGTSFTGWVPSTALRVPEASVDSIPITETTPIPRPTFDFPTSTPVIIVTRAPTQVPVATPTLGPATPTARGSDLSAQAVAGTCAVGNRLRVSVVNNGPAAIEGAPVAVLTQNAQGVQKSIVSQVVTLAVGQAVTLDTGYTVEERVIAVVDPLGTTGDPNAGNNRVDCVVGPAATATPRIATPTPAAIPTIAPTTSAPVPTATTPTSTQPTPAPTIPPIAPTSTITP